MEMNRSRWFLGIIALMLGITTVFFGYRYNQERKATLSMETEKAALNADYDALTSDFEELTAELEEMKAENVALDAELEERMSELTAQREKVNQLLRSGGSSQLKEARDMIARLESEKAILQEEVNTLRAANAQLVASNEQLASNLKQEVKKNELLTLDNASLNVELVEVTTERDRLVPLANYGQVVHVTEVEADPVKVRKDGTARRAILKGNTDQLRLCFRTEENPVAQQGRQEYMIRLVSPEGATLFEEQKGSGTFFSMDGKGEMKYTSLAVVDYKTGDENVCWYWDQAENLQKGEYQAEIYHRGHIVGQEKFVL